jgi:hypothetical protein
MMNIKTNFSLGKGHMATYQQDSVLLGGVAFCVSRDEAEADSKYVQGATCSATSESNRVKANEGLGME